MKLNGLLSSKHLFDKSDVFKFLKRTSQDGRRFTLAFVDPPSFFKDERADVSFDINQDHPKLLRSVLKVMMPGSTVFFSTNHQRFEPCLDRLRVKDLIELTPATVPEDYRNRSIHRCWKMTVL